MFKSIIPLNTSRNYCSWSRIEEKAELSRGWEEVRRYNKMKLESLAEVGGEKREGYYNERRTVLKLNETAKLRYGPESALEYNSPRKPQTISGVGVKPMRGGKLHFWRKASRGHSTIQGGPPVKTAKRVEGLSRVNRERIFPTWRLRRDSRLKV